MTADNLVESYLSDVARLLPRRQRHDVALELRTLLTEELAAKAETAGRPADETMAYDLLRDFGRPAEVAARYRPAPAIIEPADTRRFLRISVAGLLVIWSLGLLNLALLSILVARGRWEPLTRRIDIALSLATCAVLTWILLAGNIFQARPTDELVKLVILLIVLGALVDVTVKLRREPRRATGHLIMRTRSG